MNAEQATVVVVTYAPIRPWQAFLVGFAATGAPGVMIFLYLGVAAAYDAVESRVYQRRARRRRAARHPS